MRDDVVKKKKNLLMELGFRQPGLWLCIVIINLLSTLLIILYSMKGPNTLRLTVICQGCLDKEGGYVPVHTVFKAVDWSPHQSCLTKAASPQVSFNLCNKLGILDLYTPAWGGVLSLVIIELLGIGLLPIYPSCLLYILCTFLHEKHA